MTPVVGVVIPTHNRAALLPDLLEALRSQTLEDFEVVIVDDASADDTHTLLLGYATHHPWLRVLRAERNGGPATARNLGWKATQARFVVFTDDDCVPDPEWLEHLVDAAGDAGLVQGMTIPATTERGWFDRSMTVRSFSGRYQTCNLLVPRALLEEIDGFREDFPYPMGEDTDLGLRLVDRGATTAFAGRAVVRHHVWPGRLRDFIAHRRVHSRVVHLFKVNPAARDLLRGGVLVRAAHLVALAVLLSAALAIATGWPLAWSVPAAMALGWVVLTTVRTRNRPFTWPRRMGYSTLMFVGYTFELLFFLRESLRERTLVI